jgi:hypothetical protein
MKPATVAAATWRLTVSNACGTIAIETTASTAPGAMACAAPMICGSAAAEDSPAEDRGEGQGAPDGGQQRDREARGSSRDDRLGRAVGLDGVADKDSDEHGDADLAVGDRETERRTRRRRTRRQADRRRDDASRDEARRDRKAPDDRCAEVRHRVGFSRW